MARYAVLKIKPHMPPGYDSPEGARFPWMVFKGSQRQRAVTFRSWELAMRYVGRQLSRG